FLYPKNSAKRNALANRTLATRELAAYLARSYPRKRALVIANPFTLKKSQRREVYEFEQAGIRGLRLGFGKDVTIEAIVYPELRREFLENPGSVYVDPQTTTPLSYLVADNAFDKAAQEHPACEIIVSLVGLPVGVTRTELWRKVGSPKLALLLPDWRIIGEREAVREAFRSGKLAAAVLNRPGAPPESQPLEKDRLSAFTNRFLLVTAETMDEMMRTHPQLF
ncbi:MAG: hypothetical protein ABI651_14830, partial [Verrucomicrobiota bacterium]